MNTAIKLGLVGLAVLCMAPNRRAHDHIGNFNFTVEIDGISAGLFEASQGLDAVLDAAGTPQVVTEVVTLFDGQRVTAPSQGRIMVHFTLVEPAPGLPDGYTCALGFDGKVVSSPPGALRIKPTSAAQSNCR